jgi:exopolyphosphatase / guanosine-5'-triphosphate,3'-diphosphate pyrophosphatase
VEVAAHRAFVRLSAADRAGGLPDAKVRAIAAAVAEQALAARASDVAALRVVATAALRDAPGREKLLARLSEAAGAPVEILSGEEEARLAFLGATAPLRAGHGGNGSDHGTVLVADVGGGSTELAAGAPGGRIGWWASLPVGSGALAEAHLHADPPTPAELESARASAREAIDAAGCPRADEAWAVGGSATSLRRVCGSHLSAAALDDALARLCAQTSVDVALDLDLHVERARLLPAGLLLLAEVARAAGCELHVGSGGLREGVVLDLLAQVR